MAGGVGRRGGSDVVVGRAAAVCGVRCGGSRGLGRCADVVVLAAGASAGDPRGGGHRGCRPGAGGGAPAACAGAGRRDDAPGVHVGRAAGYRLSGVASGDARGAVVAGWAWPRGVARRPELQRDDGLCRHRAARASCGGGRAPAGCAAPRATGHRRVADPVGHACGVAAHACPGSERLRPDALAGDVASGTGAVGGAGSTRSAGRRPVPTWFRGARPRGMAECRGGRGAVRVGGGGSVGFRSRVHAVRGRLERVRAGAAPAGFVCRTGAGAVQGRGLPAGLAHRAGSAWRRRWGWTGSGATPRVREAAGGGSSCRSRSRPTTGFCGRTRT